MEKFKEIANDPVKLEASLKDTWSKIDTNKELHFPMMYLKPVLKK